MKKEISSVIRKAIKLIKAGWCREEYHIRRHGKDCYCLVGALREAEPKWIKRHRIEMMLEKKLESIHCVRVGLTNFNDAQKSKAGVIKFLEGCLEK